MRALFPILLVIVSVISPALVFAQGKLTMDSILSTAFSDDYFYSKHTIFNFTKGNSICPSDDCKVILDSSTDSMLFQLDNNSNMMVLVIKIRLQDDSSNHQFTPKKQILVENVDIGATCFINDIQEGKGNTRYVCNSGSVNLNRVFNHTSYDYNLDNMTFDLPSRHLVIQAQEK